MKKYEYLKTIIESMNNPKSIKSTDGKALTFKGEAADGISGCLSYRPSKSTGMAWDFKFNNEYLNKHIDVKSFIPKVNINKLIMKSVTDAHHVNSKPVNIVKFVRKNSAYVSSMVNSSKTNPRTSPDSLGFGSDSSKNYHQKDYSNIDRYGSVNNTPGPDVSDKTIIDKVVRDMNNLIERY